MKTKCSSDNMLLIRTFCCKLFYCTPCKFNEQIILRNRIRETEVNYFKDLKSNTYVICKYVIFDMNILLEPNYFFFKKRQGSGRKETFNDNN